MDLKKPKQLVFPFGMRNKNELEVGEMKRFCIESVGGMAETILGATGDKVMRDLMIDCVTKMAKHLEEEEKKELN